ncbi:MAG: VanW family protein [Proteobacteria bacterium]|nr:VanW family protein [Pseudomonadota bacterium]
MLDEHGTIVLTPEVASMQLVLPAAIEQLERAVLRGQTALVPAVYSDKRVPDAELAKISDVVSTFSTWFSVRSRNRSENIRVAAEKIHGVVLMPGETFSFNDFVGERSPENGFFEAGVYRKGRHEVGYGGGVCQVSTTLFNAVVLANMTVEKRGNHTFKVPYVALGRDAAVSYGRLDMVFVNTMEAPVAISAKWQPGKLTFTILGTKNPGVEVKLFQRMTASWDHEPIYVDDPALEPGTELEIEKGGKGYKAVTTKVVYKDGVEISRETLCESHYPGAPKIIARNETDPFGPIGPLSEKVVVPDIRSRPGR